MRELVIELLYEPHVDPVMDTFSENERLISKAVNFSDE